MSPKVLQRTCDLEDYGHSISFTRNLIDASWSQSMSIDHIISGISNSRIKMVILIGDNTTLLDQGHQFMKSLHSMDSRSWVRASFIVIYVRYWSIIDFFQWNFESTLELDYRRTNIVMGLSDPHSEFIYHDCTSYKSQICSRSVLCIRVFW